MTRLRPLRRQRGFGRQRTAARSGHWADHGWRGRRDDRDALRATTARALARARRPDARCAAAAGYDRAGTLIDEAVYEVATKAKEIRDEDRPRFRMAFTMRSSSRLA